MEDLRRVALVTLACGWALSLLGPSPVSAQQPRSGAAKPAPTTPAGTAPAGTRPAGSKPAGTNPAGSPAGGEAKPGTPPAKAGSPAAGRPAGTKPASATPPAGKTPSGVRQVQGTDDDLNEGPADETGATVRPTTRRPARAVEADAE
ncbi:MAG: hypothetical protein ACKOJF_19170, partial [Planctomycetaceae bacterium]